MSFESIHQKTRQIKWLGHDWFVASFAIWIIHLRAPSILQPIRIFLHSRRWLIAALHWIPLLYYLTQLINQIGIILLILVAAWMFPLFLIPKWRERAEKNWLHSVMYAIGMLVLTSSWWWLLNAISIVTGIATEPANSWLFWPALLFFLAELIDWILVIQ